MFQQTIKKQFNGPNLLPTKVKAQSNLGVMYNRGEGVPMTIKKQFDGTNLLPTKDMQ